MRISHFKQAKPVLWLSVLILFASFLLLAGCKWRPTFDDPAKEARYQAYLESVAPVRNQFNEAFFASNVPILNLLRSDLFKSVEQIEEEPSAKQAKQMRAFLKQLVPMTKKSRDPLVQLVGLVATSGCGVLLSTNKQLASHLKKDNQDEDSSELAAYLVEMKGYVDACKGFASRGGQFPKIDGFFDLYDAALQSNLVFIEVAKMAGVKVKANTEVVSDAAASMLARSSWSDTSMLVAGVYLDAWPATRFAKTVEPPEEFKDFKVTDVDIVLGKFPRSFLPTRLLLEFDTYSVFLAMPCMDFIEPTTDIIQSCEKMMLHVLTHTRSLESARGALETLETLANDKGSKTATRSNAWPKAAAVRRTELTQLADIDILEARDLPDLKRRLLVIRDHGSLELARRIHAGEFGETAQ